MRLFNITEKTVSSVDWCDTVKYFMKKSLENTFPSSICSTLYEEEIRPNVRYPKFVTTTVFYLNGQYYILDAKTFAPKLIQMSDCLPEFHSHNPFLQDTFNKIDWKRHMTGSIEAKNCSYLELRFCEGFHYTHYDRAFIKPNKENEEITFVRNLLSKYFESSDVFYELKELIDFPDNTVAVIRKYHLTYVLYTTEQGLMLSERVISGETIENIIRKATYNIVSQEFENLITILHNKLLYNLDNSIIRFSDPSSKNGKLHVVINKNLQVYDVYKVEETYSVCTINTVIEHFVALIPYQTYKKIDWKSLNYSQHNLPSNIDKSSYDPPKTFYLRDCTKAKKVLDALPFPLATCITRYYDSVVLYHSKTDSWEAIRFSQDYSYPALACLFF